MAKYVLIGGRSVEFLEDFSLEEKIFESLGKSHPSILFIPMASHKNYESSIQKFRKLTKQSACKIEVLKDVNDSLLEQKIQAADVIYFGGGCAEELIYIVKHSPLGGYLKKYEASDKIYMGISAGAILFCNFGMGDRYVYTTGYQTYNYQMVEGLHILDITICPHYNHEGIDCYNQEVKHFTCDGYALEDDTALLIDKTIRIYKRTPKRSVYRFTYEKSYLMEPLYEGNL